MHSDLILLILAEKQSEILQLRNKLEELETAKKMVTTLQEEVRKLRGDSASMDAGVVDHD